VYISVMSFDKTIAIETFVTRYRENQGKQINNSSLYAGSDMYYYCRHCGIHTQTLPESHWGRPVTICVPCEALETNGLIPEAVRVAKAPPSEPSTAWDRINDA